MLPLQNFLDYICQNSLFDPDQRILLAVSGGKDSVVMAHFFKEAGFKFGIAHCNFGLRDEESQRDERFVSSLAVQLEVPLYVTHFATKAYAAEHKVSTQMAARDLRYHWFEEIRQQESYAYIAVAHHQDDAIETVLLNLVRGTGIAGLHGILPKRDYLIRPLLFLSRAGIDEAVQENNYDFVEDSSNLSTAYARNKLRLGVIPLLKEINPNLEQTFEHNILRFAETEIVLQQTVARIRAEICAERREGIYFSLEKIKALHPQQLLLFELLKTYNFTEAVVEDILNSLEKQSGTSFYSASHRLTVDRDELILTVAGKEEIYTNKVIHPSDTEIPFGSQIFSITYSDEPAFENNPQKAFIDADQLIFPLIVRTWQDGDRFMPIGMRNYKKLSDFFIDQKIPLPQKDSIPILINGNGDVVWVAGLRQDNRYKVTATTKKVAIFEQKLN
ncbi:tRNA(Ile)-lysidine synthase [Pedobacter cryoconitis]|uniref:tRNA lysidine(34) synthetase TilS n=1 Tax=Pedobacter cryoconitis TaxID=188932 RepID=UPI00160FEC09|nr:tRNA lysidine(34) synthetase TilS [Pedobacter cryoconitis]MBB6273159.1 tRNA(Ile)-lysidine synthase [Pedobacter cryoconitis]